jgi:hypothetical protein
MQLVCALRCDPALTFALNVCTCAARGYSGGSGFLGPPACSFRCCQSETGGSSYTPSADMRLIKSTKDPIEACAVSRYRHRKFSLSVADLRQRGGSYLWCSSFPPSRAGPWVTECRVDLTKGSISRLGILTGYSRQCLLSRTIEIRCPQSTHSLASMAGTYARRPWCGIARCERRPS